ncbi:MAG TPA: hypothetical protein VEC57_18210 [Candidatus Limnocylindrales bacterium]|nr:hypothetical protein [Candidatus Limnocylindrales bacterium]
MNSDRAFRIYAVLFGLLAISNLTKPLEMSQEVGFVFFGQRLKGTPNLLIAPLFGLYMAAYAYGLWKKRRFALPMGLLYAGYVPLNLFLFRVRMPEEASANSLFGIVYMIVAIGVSWSAALLLLRRAGELNGR